MPLRFAAALLLLLATATSWWWFVEVAAAGRVFNVSDFGAVADGRTDDSEAFLRAWTKACATPGRAAVVVPRGDVTPWLLK